MAKGSKNVVSVVREALEPVITELGYRLWDLEYVKEGAEYFLRFTIDSDDGITIDDCEKVHRTIDPLLDELDPIEGSYNLQVSSPGLERDVKYDWHYAALIGEKLELKLYAPIEEYPAKKRIFSPLLQNKGYWICRRIRGGFFISDVFCFCVCGGVCVFLRQIR